MVADDYPWLVECHAVAHAVGEPHAGYAVLEHDEARGLIDQSVQVPALLFRYPPHLEVDPYGRIDDYEHDGREEQQGVGRPHVLHHPSPEPQGHAVNDSQHAEQRVQHTDAGEVLTWTEVAHSFLFRWVVHTDGYLYQLRTVPGSEYQQFQFCLVT